MYIFIDKKEQKEYYSKTISGLNRMCKYGYYNITYRLRKCNFFENENVIIFRGAKEGKCFHPGNVGNLKKITAR